MPGEGGLRSLGFLGSLALTTTWAAECGECWKLWWAPASLVGLWSITKNERLSRRIEESTDGAGRGDNDDNEDDDDEEEKKEEEESVKGV